MIHMTITHPTTTLDADSPLILSDNNGHHISVTIRGTTYTTPEYRIELNCSLFPPRQSPRPRPPWSPRSQFPRSAALSTIISKHRGANVRPNVQDAIEDSRINLSSFTALDASNIYDYLDLIVKYRRNDVLIRYRRELEPHMDDIMFYGIEFANPHAVAFAIRNGANIHAYKDYAIRRARHITHHSSLHNEVLTLVQDALHHETRDNGRESMLNVAILNADQDMVRELLPHVEMLDLSGYMIRMIVHSPAMLSILVQKMSGESIAEAYEHALRWFATLPIDAQLRSSELMASREACNIMDAHGGFIRMETFEDLLNFAIDRDNVEAVQRIVSSRIFNNTIDLDAIHERTSARTNNPAILDILEHEFIDSDEEDEAQSHS